MLRRKTNVVVLVVLVVLFLMAPVMGILASKKSHQDPLYANMVKVSQDYDSTTTIGYFHFMNGIMVGKSLTSYMEKAYLSTDSNQEEKLDNFLSTAMDSYSLEGELAFLSGLEKANSTSSCLSEPLIALEKKYYQTYFSEIRARNLYSGGISTVLLYSSIQRFHDYGLVSNEDYEMITKKYQNSLIDPSLTIADRNSLMDDMLSILKAIDLPETNS